MQDVRHDRSVDMRAIKISIAVVLGLIALKVVVGLISGSMSILAQATDSLLDIFSIFIIYMALKISGAPADEDHPFGHGKMEGLAAGIQAILIFGAGGIIVYSSIQRIISTRPLEPSEGMMVMVVSIGASFFLSRYLKRVAGNSESTAILALAGNISADVYSAFGVLLGLLMVELTGIMILDPIIALVMALFVLKSGIDVGIRAIQELTDYALSDKEQEMIDTCLSSHKMKLVEYHAMRSRRAGRERFIDLHLVMPRYITVEEAHGICDHLEQDIKENIVNANVIIHVEPCNSEYCDRCSIPNCNLRANHS